MNEHFNKLTPAEAERLAMLAEECAEVIQIVGKILRHGYESFHPEDEKRVSNRKLLEKELTDLVTVANIMEEADDIDVSSISDQEADCVHERKMTYTHHQRNR